MGGPGSGNTSVRQAVEDCVTLSLSKMLQAGQLTSHRSTQEVIWTDWTGNVSAALTIEIHPTPPGLAFYLCESRQYVDLHSTPLRFGGVRWWFSCPGCGRRCAKLHRPRSGEEFYCRLCCGLTYRSCQESGTSQALYASIAARIGRGSARDVAQVLKNIAAQNRPRWKPKRKRPLGQIKKESPNVVFK